MTRLAFSVLFMLAALSGANAQQPPKVIIAEQPGGQIDVAPYVEGREAAFTAFLDKLPHLAEQKPFALMLTNHGNKAVVALAMRWIFVKDGHETEHKSSTNSLRAGAKPIAEPHGRLFITPVVSIPEYLVEKGGGMVGGGGGLAGPMARQSDFVRAYVDAVIFEDGEVIGPDRNGLTESLKARRAAAEEVAAAIATARKAGKSDAEIVWELGAVRPARGDANEMVKFSMMRQLSMSRNLDRDVEKLRGMRLPEFYRREKK